MRSQTSQEAETVVVGLNWVGDNVLALPTYRALAHRYRSEGGIAVAAPGNVASLLAATGVFKEVVAWSSGTRDRISALRAGSFKRAVILPNSFRGAFIPLAAGIRERWGYASDARRIVLSHPVVRKHARRHQVDDYAELLAAMNAPRVVDELPSLVLPFPIRDRARRAMLDAGATLDSPVFGLHPGGLYGRAKHWGDSRFREVASRLRDQGFEVVLLTSPGERLQAEAISAACGGLPMVGHEGDVLHLAAAISHCAVVITNDSGPLHLAAALAVPTVSIFGPTDPERTVIPGASQVLREPMACQPCYRRECPLGHHRCMRDISVDDVFNSAVSLYASIAGTERIRPTIVAG
jgi:heptosyltransferase II